MRLRTAVADSESRHHFIEDEKCSVFFGELSQALQKSWFRLDESCIANNGLKNHSGDGIGVLSEQLFYRFQIVVRGGQSVCCSASGHPGGIG